jgi:hypothetical protein
MSGLIAPPTLWLRLWRGAVTLSPFEVWLLGECVRHLPTDFQPALREQLAGSNLVQRDPEWRELRFYRIVRGRVDRSALPLLPVRPGEVKLLSLAARLPDRAEPLHAVLWAVDRRVAMLNFEPGIRAYAHLAAATVDGVRQSWRSNVVSDGGPWVEP